MDPDGSNKELLTDRLYADPWYDWSPDGSQIVFAGKEPDDEHGDLYVVDVADGSVTRLGGTDVADYEPVWSPDGTSIAWTGGLDVYTMDADGSGVTLLAEEAAGPRWSPDSQSIAFESWRNDTADPEYGPYTWEIFVIGRDGSGERRLTHAPDARNGDLDWSPDGSEIAYVRAFDDDMWKGEPDVFVIDVATAEVTRVGTSRFYEGPPQWGPDGGYLVYPSNADLIRKTPGSTRRSVLTPGPVPRVGEVVDL